MTKKLMCGRILLLLLVLLLMQGCQAQTGQSKMNIARNGTMDLTGWDFSGDGNVRLDGTWEFYWERLIAPGTFESAGEPTGYFDIPTYWSKYEGLELPSKGYGTYRLKVETDGRNNNFSLMTPEIYTEYSLWINGERVHSSGRFFSGKTSYLKPDIYDFTADGPEVEIVLQVRNDIHARSGIGHSFKLGLTNSIHGEYERNSAVDLILFLICFIAGLHHLILYFFRNKDKELAFFGALCLLVSVRSLLSNETLLMQVIPDMPFWIGSKIFTMTVPLCALSLLYYTRSLFEKDIPEMLFKAFAVLNAIYALIVLIVPPYVYSSLFVYFAAVIMIFLALCLTVAVRAVVKKRPESGCYSFGIVFFIIGTYVDYLTFIQLADREYILPAAMTAFIASQAVLLAKRYAESFHRTEQLSENLQATLDKVLNTETAFLNAQMKPHFLYNALNTIAQCCETDSREAERLILSLSKYLRGTLDFENLEGLVPLSRELELVRAYVSIEKARFDNLEVEYDLSDVPLEIRIPPLTLQPLVENAIKHGVRAKETGGTVRLRATRQNGSLRFAVEDNGEGIPEEKLEELLAIPKGSAGIGLYNINTRLARLYGKGLSVRSPEGAGTIVSFEIPFEE